MWTRETYPLTYLKHLQGVYRLSLVLIVGQRSPLQVQGVPGCVDRIINAVWFACMQTAHRLPHLNSPPDGPALVHNRSGVDELSHMIQRRN